MKESINRKELPPEDKEITMKRLILLLFLTSTVIAQTNLIDANEPSQWKDQSLRLFNNWEYYLNSIGSTADPNLFTALGFGYNVIDYGAENDGTGDNTTAIQAAIDAANAAGGGTVYFPDGIFACASGLTMYSGVHIRGAGRQQTELRYTAASGDFITGGSNLNRVGFYDIKIGSSNSSSGWGIFFDSSTVRQMRIEHVAVNLFLKGIKVDDGLQCVVDQLYIVGQGQTEAGGIGFQFGHDSGQAGTTWAVNSLYCTTMYTGIIQHASYSHFSQIIVEATTVAININTGSVWDTVWGASNTLFWDIDTNGIVIRDYRYGATTDYVFDGDTVENRTTILPGAADRNVDKGPNYKLTNLRGYTNGAWTLSKTTQTETGSDLPDPNNSDAGFYNYGFSQFGSDANNVTVSAEGIAQFDGDGYWTGGFELSNATDTTLARSSAGRVTIETAGLTYTDSVDVNSAEILDLADTPITLVAAQGTDTCIEFVSATLIHDAGTAYVEPSAPDDLVIEYSGGQDVTAAIDSTNFLTVTDDEARLVPFDVSVMAITTDLVALKNTALQLFNTGADLTTGTGTMTVKVTYRVHTLGL